MKHLWNKCKSVWKILFTKSWSAFLCQRRRRRYWLLTAALQKGCPATDTLINGAIEWKPHFHFPENIKVGSVVSEWSWKPCGNHLTFPFYANSVQQRQAHLAGNTCRKGDEWFGSSSAESVLRITGDEKSMNQHCAKKANIIRGCINRSLKYRPVKIVSLLHLAL